MHLGGFVVLGDEYEPWPTAVKQFTEDNFVASYGWCMNFVRRRGISLRRRTRVSQDEKRSPQELADIANDYLQKVPLATFGYPANRIGNMDQTPMFMYALQLELYSAVTFTH